MRSTLFISIIVLFFRAISVSYASTNEPVVGLVGIQKDEIDILDIWLEYHTILFGASNIVLIDNGSKGAKMLRKLSDLSNKGLSIIYLDPPVNETLGISDLMFSTAMERFAKVDIILTLNVYEFICGFSKHGPQRSKEAVLHMLKIFSKSTHSVLNLLPYYRAIAVEKTDKVLTQSIFTPQGHHPLLSARVFKRNALRGKDMQFNYEALRRSPTSPMVKLAKSSIPPRFSFPENVGGGSAGLVNFNGTVVGTNELGILYYPNHKNPITKISKALKGIVQFVPLGEIVNDLDDMQD